MVSCPLCGRPSGQSQLAEVGWLAPEILARLVEQNPGWRKSDGACPACVQRVLLETLLERGDAALHLGIQAAWPLDAEAAFGALPTPLRLHAHPHYTGRGVTIALVDSAFYPHPDLTRPTNRIRAWVEAGRAPVRALFFGPHDVPQWPRWGAGEAAQWHGLMTTTVDRKSVV